MFRISAGVYNVIHRVLALLAGGCDESDHDTIRRQSHSARVYRSVTMTPIVIATTIPHHDNHHHHQTQLLGACMPYMEPEGAIRLQ